MLAWIEAGHGDPLLSAHIVGQDQQLTEELDGTGSGDAGGADEQLVGVLEMLLGSDEVKGPPAQMPDLSRVMDKL